MVAKQRIVLVLVCLILLTSFGCATQRNQATRSSNPVFSPVPHDGIGQERGKVIPREVMVFAQKSLQAAAAYETQKLLREEISGEQGSTPLEERAMMIGGMILAERALNYLQR